MNRALLAVLLASACADDPGPLDRETIAAIARDRGDAQGGERTGTYHAMVEIGHCDCPDDLGLAVCLSQDLAESVVVSIDVVEADGFMVAHVDAVPQLELSGAIDADGTATLGSTYVIFDLESDAVILGRLDAQFGEDGELTGHASLRAEGTIVDGSISCSAEIDIEAMTF